MPRSRRDEEAINQAGQTTRTAMILSSIGLGGLASIIGIPLVIFLSVVAFLAGFGFCCCFVPTYFFGRGVADDISARSSAREPSTENTSTSSESTNGYQTGAWAVDSRAGKSYLAGP